MSPSTAFAHQVKPSATADLRAGDGRAGEPAIAAALEAQGAFVYAGLAGAVLVAVAACLAGADLAAAHNLPRRPRGFPGKPGPASAIVVPRAQVRPIGGVSVMRLVALPGGRAMS